ncbi:hypothetical protein [Halpernia frigidisoli]|uniref:Uncharacterized protein n=1 Tax=Halpernia frigidisoli TaxID=1125876 RepID=A0A1I3DMH3_9FLAO|nr:hypothetical protein [Halpernia frigidisoli]SFH87873.1 hypothetical protein SAMN05443292_0576 [Halpernia frigidisoli]
MKTRLLIITMFLFAFAPFAKSQTPEHLSFKGIPIDGTLNNYIAKMKLGGFTHNGTNNGMAILKGDFAGYKGCVVGVSTLKQKDLVSKIAVIFPQKDTWSSLADNYFNLKQLLTKKYGEPSEVVEKFDSMLYSEDADDGRKMYGVQFDNCKYYSIFSTELGNIQLSIDHDGVDSCFVKLIYLDKINTEITNLKALEDL